MARSKLSKQVLTLYKEFMVAAASKPGFKDRIRLEFKANASIPLSESQRIEFIIRRAKRQLETVKNPRTVRFDVLDPNTAPGTEAGLPAAAVSQRSTA